MIGLTLLACHLLGDFVLQNRWQAGWKLNDWRVRVQHVCGYTVPFVPVAFALADSWLRAVAFLLWLAILHYATDSRRFRSTLGDVIQWRISTEEGKRREWGRQPLPFPPTTRTDFSPLPPNPWPPTALMIDQALHIAQIAALGWLLT